jgi:hypothetical protein
LYIQELAKHILSLGKSTLFQVALQYPPSAHACLFILQNTKNALAALKKAFFNRRLFFREFSFTA